ncbi:hypothetical protein LHJ74_27055 [Streptomyces sp. N2-109]|uniref:Integral membrane protein n=1 Tax=Streptomyces gossypii TaxID=2883101 RepID=A0ABT2K020_9ACTN|nr:hypothetical protein [Streptomyces gossypii]MCT2593518.1 hypothetical protein [Streptomyces gossypii]
MTESPGLSVPDDCASSDGDEESLRPGPLWRHALWVAAVTVLGVGLAWVNASFRLGHDEYGMPLAASGHVRPYLMAWTATGLAAAAALRVVAARAPLYCPEVPVVVLTFMGTRLSLGFRPEPPVLGAMTAAALTAVVIWCALARPRGIRGYRGRRATSGERGAG